MTVCVENCSLIDTENIEIEISFLLSTEIEISLLLSRLDVRLCQWLEYINC